MTLDEFMKHAADAAFVGDADLLRGYAKQVFNERDEARAEVERLTAAMRQSQEMMRASRWKHAQACIDSALHMKTEPHERPCDEEEEDE